MGIACSFSCLRIAAVLVGLSGVAAADPSFRRVEIPFLPGSALTLHWKTDVGIDRSELLACESKTSRWSDLCDLFHASGEQKMTFDVPIDITSDDPSPTGYQRPHPVLALQTTEGAVELELVPVLSQSLTHAADQLTPLKIQREGERIVCLAPPEDRRVRAIHSLQWRIERGGEPSLEFESEVLTPNQLAGAKALSCTLVWFDGLFFRKWTTRANPADFSAPVPTPSPAIAPPPTPTDTIAPEPLDLVVNTITTPLFVTAKPGTFGFEAHAIPPSDQPWRCRVEPAVAGKCVVSGEGARRFIEVSLSAPPPAMVVTSLGSGDGETASSITHVIAPSSPLVSVAERGVEVVRTSSERLACLVPPGTTPAFFAWFRNGQAVIKSARSPTHPLDRSPAEPIRHTCIAFWREGDRLRAGLGEHEQKPSEPRWKNLPDAILVDPSRPSRWNFDWESSIPEALRLSCHLETREGRILRAVGCTQENGHGPNQGHALFEITPTHLEGLEASGAASWTDAILRLRLQGLKNEFEKRIPVRVLSTDERPRVVAAVQYPETSSRAACLFVVTDPDRSHLTATLRWLDDPGRSEVYSTFPREGFHLLTPPRDIEGVDVAAPSYVRAGKATLDFRSGRASCDVTVSDGVLFARLRARSFPNRNLALAALRERLARPWPSRGPSVPRLATPDDTSTTQPPEGPKRSRLTHVFIDTASSDSDLSWWRPERGSCTGGPALCEQTLPLARRNPSALHDALPGLAFLFDTHAGIPTFAIVEVRNPAFSASGIPLNVTSATCSRLATAVRLGLLPWWLALDVTSGTGAVSALSQIEAAPGGTQCRAIPFAMLKAKVLPDNADER